MKYLILLIGTVLPALSLAHYCDKILDRDERLACYDRSGACVTIESKESRLRCYDRAAAIAESSMSDMSDKGINDVSGAPVETKEEHADLIEDQIRKDDQAFPVRSNDPPTKDPDPEIHSRISAVGKSAHGFVRLSLENKQVWTLKQKTPIRFEPGQQVKIVKGFLGSNILIDVISGRRFKVKRER